MISTGYNDTFGNYIEIKHDGDYSTFYGHLNKIFVELHHKVNSTMIIAEVGYYRSFDRTTFAFEVRRDGRAKIRRNLHPDWNNEETAYYF